MLRQLFTSMEASIKGARSRTNSLRINRVLPKSIYLPRGIWQTLNEGPKVVSSIRLASRPIKPLYAYAALAFQWRAVVRTKCRGRAWLGGFPSGFDEFALCSVGIVCLPRPHTTSALRGDSLSK